MKYFQIMMTFIILCVSCSNEKENLDYPNSIEEIEEVIISRPDKESNGKFAEQKKLNEKEIKELLEAIRKSEPIGLTKFYPDYFIFFKTKEGENKRIIVNGNTIKGYKNDLSYEFKAPMFINGF